MKIKILLPVLLVLVFSVLVGNWIYGRMAAQRLDAYLQHSSQKVDIEYDRVQVNPLWSKIIFTNFSYTDPASQVSVASEKLCVVMKYAELLAISKSHKVDELTKLGLDFESLTMREGDALLLRSKNVQFDFKGVISYDTFVKMEEEFPKEKQYAEVVLKGVEFNNTTLGKVRYVNVLAGIQHLNVVRFALSFDPDNRAINVDTFKMETEKLNFAGSAQLTYLGQGWNDFLTSVIDVEYGAKLNGKMSWDNVGSQENYSLESFSSQLDAKLEFNKDGGLVLESSEADLTFNMKGVTMIYGSQRKKNIDMSLSMLGLKSDDLNVQAFSLHSTLNAGKWTIENATLLLPMLQANLQADVQLNGNNLKDSNIDAFELRVSQIDPKLNESIGNLAGNFGIQIPRDGDDIVLEVQGSIGNPRVKGIQ